METKDCFAYRRSKCKTLVIPKCQGIDCPFYKTKKQAKEDKKKAMKRILSLDKEIQDKINETYYKGKIGGKSNEC